MKKYIKKVEDDNHESELKIQMLKNEIEKVSSMNELEIKTFKVLQMRK